MKRSTAAPLAALLFTAAAAVFGGGGGCQPERRGDRATEPAGGHTSVEHDALLPGRVLAGFRRQFPEAQIKHVQRQSGPGDAEHYHVDYEAKSGQRGSVHLNERGEVVPQR